MISDILFMTFLFAASTCVGVFFTTRCAFPGRYLASPLIGFSFLATIVTLAYIYGATAKVCTLVVLIVSVLAGILSARRAIIDFKHLDLKISLSIVVIAFLAILPKWTGGNYFYSFQLNPYDQFNYLKFSTVFAHFSYDTIKAPPEWWSGAGNMFMFASQNADLRPGVNIVHATFFWPFFSTAIEAYYPYMAFFQLMMALSLAFIILQVEPQRHLLAVILGGIFALGPLFQHTIDLNAWSQTAGMPLAYVTIGLGLSALIDGKPSPWMLACLAASLSGLLFIYPEITSVVGMAGIAMAMAHLVMKGRIAHLMRLAIPCVCAILLAALYWRGTLGFLLNQLQYAAQLPRIDWAHFYDNQLFGRDVDYWGFINANIPLSNYQLASAVIDPAMGAAGLYYLLPTDQADFSTRIAIKSACVVLLLALAISAALVIYKSRQRRLLAIGMIGCMVPATVALGQHYVWTAGKALGMASPALFVLATFPIFVTATPVLLRLAAMVLVTVHSYLGLLRPAAAAQEQEYLFASPYPHYPGKEDTEWDILTKIPQFERCKAIDIDVRDPLLDTYLQVTLFGKQLPWRTLQAIRPSYELDRIIDPTVPSPAADCLVTDYADGNAYKATFDLRRP